MPAPDRANQIRQFILEQVTDHPGDIARLTAEHFGISRQMAARRLRALVDEGLLEASGTTKGRAYVLRNLVDETIPLVITPDFQEDIVWRRQIAPHLQDVPGNVREICQYGVTEMLNNVLDHSGSPRAYVGIERKAIGLSIVIRDFGVGIFNKIQHDFNLDDPRDALLELAKGKLSSDERRHSGEGIFFTSRMFDNFVIVSGKLLFRHMPTGDDWLVETDPGDEVETGTLVTMEIKLTTDRTRKQIFDRYTAEFDDYGFTKTHVPVKLAKYGDDQLVSRSQAKRVLARFERFKEVVLDFKDVPTIGQAFADEIFRVFRTEHPEVKLYPVNTSPDVDSMILHVTSRMFENRGNGG